MFLRLQARGYIVQADNDNRYVFTVSYDRDSICLKVDEKIRQYRHVFTADEQRKHWNPNAKWTQIKEPTGKLRARVYDRFTHGSERDVIETDEKPLKLRLGEIIGYIKEEIAHVKTRRLQREEAENLRHEREKEHLRLARLVKLEADRKLDLEKKALDWHKAGQIRDYVAAVEVALKSNALQYLPETFETWKSWALTHANSIDPIKAENALTDLTPK